MSISSDQRAGLIGLPAQYRSKTERVRELLPEIDAAMARGVPQQTIVDQLAADGLHLTLDQLRNCLHRIRKPKPKRKPPPDAKSPSAPAATPVPTRPAPASAGFDFKQHRDNKPKW